MSPPIPTASSPYTFYRYIHGEYSDDVPQLRLALSSAQCPAVQRTYYAGPFSFQQQTCSAFYRVYPPLDVSSQYDARQFGCVQAAPLLSTGFGASSAAPGGCSAVAAVAHPSVSGTPVLAAPLAGERLARKVPAGVDPVEYSAWLLEGRFGEYVPGDEQPTLIPPTDKLQCSRATRHPSPARRDTGVTPAAPMCAPRWPAGHPVGPPPGDSRGPTVSLAVTFRHKGAGYFRHIGASRSG